MPRALQLLAELARELHEPHSFNELLQLVVERCAALLDTPRATIRLLDASGTRLLAVCRAGDPLHLNPNEEFEVGEGLMGWIVANAEPLRTGDADNDPRFAKREGQKSKLGSFVGAPLIAGNTPLGVLGAADPSPNRFDRDAEHQLTLLAGLAAPHIEIARRDFVVRDPLTGLSNHAHFQQHLEREIERSVSYGLPFSLVFVDVDRFEKLNDAHGHRRGDDLLRRVAEVVSGHSSQGSFRLRGQDLVARFGGDEFALILPYTSKEGACAKAEMLREHIAQMDLANLELEPQSVSVGVATVPDDAHDRASVIAAAKTAVNAAKRSGRNTTIAYSRALTAAKDSQLAIDVDKLIALDQTIDNKGICYLYQPIVDAMSHAIVAFEALCRPNHEAFSGPAALIETAEHAGRVLELGRICRSVSMSPFSQLDDSCVMFVNLHPREIDTALLHEQPMADVAGRIVLEITETAAIADYERVRDVIAALREHGYRIALDDLGAGYAGLNSLALLQPDFVKLDMALIRGIHEKSSSRRLVKHLLEFCMGENIPVIAEGVETEAEHDKVRELGCPLLQGNYLARPGMPFPDLDVMG